MTKLLSLILLAATAAVSLFVAQPLQAATAVVQPHRTILDEGARLLPGNMVLDVAVRRRVAGGVGVRRGVVGGIGYWRRPIAGGYRAGYLGRPALGYWAGERSMPAGMCPKKDEAIVILSKDPFCAAHHLSDDACQETWKAYWSETAQYNGFLTQCRMLHWPEHKA